mgnify:CR=1 FL=1
MSKYSIKWGDRKIKGANALFKWNTAPNLSSYPRYTWNDVELIIAAGGDLINEPWQQWGDEKKKKLIKLICKVKGVTYKNSKYVNDYKIKVSDVKLATKKILGIEVITENIKF